MKNSKEITKLKNGKVSENVWVNKNTNEIYPANKNSFGFNALSVIGDDFYSKYGKDLKTNQGKSDYTKFYYSAKSMESVGFTLVKRGDNI